MSTGPRFRTLGAAVFLAAAVLCASLPTAASATTAHSQRKRAKKKTPPPPPLPSGPTGPVQQIPLDSIAAVPPQVTFQNNELTIVAPNSTLADILRAVKKQTGAEIDVPAAPERVVTRLGPGPAHDVLSDLLNGSRFNYVLLGAPGNESVLTRVVLVPKTGNSAEPAPQPQQPAMAQNPPADEDPSSQAMDADSEDNNANNVDETPEQPATDDQQQNAEQPQVKTPQQMLQEMQQRQLMLQQQQPPNQPPVPGSGMPPHPPQEQ